MYMAAWRMLFLVYNNVRRGATYLLTCDSDGDDLTLVVLFVVVLVCVHRLH